MKDKGPLGHAPTARALGRPPRFPPMRAALVLALLGLLAAPPALAAAEIPGQADSATDGAPFVSDAPSVLEALREVNASVSGQRIHDCVAEATAPSASGSSYRLMGTPTHDAFLAAYKDVFSKMGLPSALHKFAKGGASVGPIASPMQGGTNIIGVLPGLDATKWIVVGGHYDTRELTLGGGALDNASGFCTVAELARVMKAYVDAHGPLQASVVFAWYDGEEWGLYGAVAFAEDPSVAKQLLGLPQEAPVDVVVSQSFDMPGLNYPAKNNWVQYGEQSKVDEYAVLNLRTAPIHAEKDWTCWSYGCYQKLKEADDFARILDRNTRYQYLVREVAYDLLGLPREYVWVYDDHYGRSDHIPLIARGAAGNRIQGSHDQEYPHYHQPTDTLPALYVQAGSKENLIAAYDVEARAGGLVAFYTALTGDVGQYAPSASPGLLTSASAIPDKTAATPAPALGIALGALAAVAMLMRGSRVRR